MYSQSYPLKLKKKNSLAVLHFPFPSKNITKERNCDFHLSKETYDLRIYSVHIETSREHGEHPPFWPYVACAWRDR